MVTFCANSGYTVNVMGESTRVTFWANSECNLHVPIGAKLDPRIWSIQNMPILYPLGILESYFWEYWKCAHLFSHWVHWSHMARHIQNVLSMYPLGILGSHGRVYSKCTQHLITGHIGVICWLCSQCFHHVPSGYLGPCPQWHTGEPTILSKNSRVELIWLGRKWTWRLERVLASDQLQRTRGTYLKRPVVLNSFLMILGEDLLKLNKLSPGFFSSLGGSDFSPGCLIIL